MTPAPRTDLLPDAPHALTPAEALAALDKLATTIADRHAKL